MRRTAGLWTLDEEMCLELRTPAAAQQNDARYGQQIVALIRNNRKKARHELIERASRLWADQLLGARDLNHAQWLLQWRRERDWAAIAAGWVTRNSGKEATESAVAAALCRRARGYQQQITRIDHVTAAVLRREPPGILAMPLEQAPDTLATMPAPAAAGPTIGLYERTNATSPDLLLRLAERLCAYGAGPGATIEVRMYAPSVMTEALNLFIHLEVTRTLMHGRADHARDREATEAELQEHQLTQRPARAREFLWLLPSSEEYDAEQANSRVVQGWG